MSSVINLSVYLKSDLKLAGVCAGQHWAVKWISMFKMVICDGKQQKSTHFGSETHGLFHCSAFSFSVSVFWE